MRRGGRWSRGKETVALSNFNRVRDGGRLSGLGGNAPLQYSKEVREGGGVKTVFAVKEVRLGGKFTSVELPSMREVKEGGREVRGLLK